MIKFVHENDNASSDHWNKCSELHAPFIKISRVDAAYSSVFFDITNFSVDLDEVSKDVKKLHVSYVDFFMCYDPIMDQRYDNHYFFELVVKYEHAEFIAAGLYDYLLNKIRA